MFIGKNFVFDRRMSEKVTDDVIGKCHICNNPADNHVDCNNDSCHILFIQCEDCNKKLEGCCSQECKDFYFLPKSKQQEKNELFEKMNIKNENQLPEISLFDPVAKAMFMKPGDVCKITRHDIISFQNDFYRICVI